LDFPGIDSVALTTEPQIFRLYSQKLAKFARNFRQRQETFLQGVSVIAIVEISVLCPSHAGIVSKRRKLVLRNHLRIAPAL